LIVGFELDAAKANKKENIYFTTMMTLAGFAFIGLGVNIWLYLDDINNRGGVLNEIKKKKEQSLTALMTSPAPTRHGYPTDIDEEVAEQEAVGLEVYGVRKSTRDALKRSMAKLNR
jgi:hypothetical protein